MQRRSLLLGSLGITASAVVSACSNGGSGSASVAVSDASDAFGYQETGLPITTKPLPLKFSGTKSALAPKYETMSLVQQWKKDTNIDITWDNLPETVYQEKKNLMLASGLYTSVQVTKINPSDTDAAVQALIAPSSEQDILLVAPMSYFVDGLNFIPKFNKLGRHIAPVVRNDGTKLAFWSWGDEPIESLGMTDDGSLAPPTLDGVAGGYSMAINLPELKKTVTDSKASRWVVTATLKPA